MTISVLEALEQHRYVYFGFESHPTDKDPWQATPIMAYSALTTVRAVRCTSPTRHASNVPN